MNIRTLICLILFLTTVSFGQNKHQVTGRFETPDSLALAGLNLLFESQKEQIHGRTNAIGEFKEDLAPGDYKLTIEPVNLYDFTAFVRITDNGLNPSNVRFLVDPAKVCCKNSDGSLFPELLSFPKPPYPPIARAVRATGEVIVKVEIDESGEVISSKALNGYPLLRRAAEAVAQKARFAISLTAGHGSLD